MNNSAKKSPDYNWYNNFVKINLVGAKNLKVYGLIGSIVLILIVILIAISRQYFDSPSPGMVSAQIVQTTAKASDTSLMVEGKTFSFSYSSVFQPTSASSLAINDIEKFSFVANQSSPWNLSVIISNLPTGRIEDDGSYNYRKTNPKTYTEQAVSFNSNIMHIMTSNTGGYNKVVFIGHGNIEAVIALISNGSADSQKMDLALNQILSTWQWL